MSDLTVKLRADGTQLQKSLNDAKTVLSKYKKEAAGLNGVAEDQAKAFNKSVNSLNKTINSSKNAAQTAKGLEREIANLKLQYSQLSATAERSDFGKAMAASIKNAEKQLGNLNTMLGKTKQNMGGGFTIPNIKGNIGDMTKEIAAVNPQLNAMVAMGSKLANPYIAATAAVAGLSKAWYDYASTFDAQMQKTQKYLGIQGDELTSIRNRVKSVSDVYGTDFNSNLSMVDTLTKQFGISASKAMDAIEVGMAGGANATGRMSENISKFGGQLKDAGFNAEELIGILGQTESGVFSEQGIEVITKGAQKIREMSKGTADALKQIGINGVDMSKKLANGSMSSAQAIQEISNKLKTLNPDTQAYGDVVKNVFGKVGLAAGSELINMLGDMDISLQGVIENMTETQRATYDLQKADEKLEDALASLFGTSTSGFASMTTQLKTKVAEAVTAVINKFIELYNKSILVRAGFQSIAIGFKNAWEVIKGICRQLIISIEGVADVIDGLITMDFGKIYDGAAKAFKATADNYKKIGNEIGSNIIHAMDETFHGKIEKVHVEVDDKGEVKVKQDKKSGGKVTDKSQATKKENALSKAETEYKLALEKIEYERKHANKKEVDAIDDEIKAIKTLRDAYLKVKNKTNTQVSRINQLNAALISAQNRLTAAKDLQSITDATNEYLKDLNDAARRLSDGLITDDEYNNRYKDSLKKLVDEYYKVKSLTTDQRRAQQQYIALLREFDIDKAKDALGLKQKQTFEDINKTIDTDLKSIFTNTPKANEQYHSNLLNKDEAMKIVRKLDRLTPIDDTKYLKDLKVTVDAGKDAESKQTDYTTKLNTINDQLKSLEGEYNNAKEAYQKALELKQWQGEYDDTPEEFRKAIEDQFKSEVAPYLKTIENYEELQAQANDYTNELNKLEKLIQDGINAQDTLNTRGTPNVVTISQEDRKLLLDKFNINADKITNGTVDTDGNLVTDKQGLENLINTIRNLFSDYSSIRRSEAAENLKLIERLDERIKNKTGADKYEDIISTLDVTKIRGVIAPQQGANDITDLFDEINNMRKRGLNLNDKELQDAIDRLKTIITEANKIAVKGNSDSKGDKSNFRLNQTSYEELVNVVDKRMQGVELTGFDKLQNLLDTKLKQYQDAEQKQLEAQQKLRESGLDAYQGDDKTKTAQKVQLESVITFSKNSMKQLEDEINDLSKKYQDSLVIDMRLQGTGELLSGIETIGNLAQSWSNLGDSVENAKNDFDAFMTVFGAVTSTFQTVIGLIQTFNEVEQLFAAATNASTLATQVNTAEEEAKAAALIATTGAGTAAMTTDGELLASSLATIPGIEAQTQALHALTAALNTAAYASIPFAGVGLATAAQATYEGLWASARIPTFANGGLVKAATNIGDRAVIRVNGGEAVLNTQQQGRLWKILDGQVTPNNSSNIGSGDVTFRIEGSTLYGALKNYSKIANKKLF